MPTHTLQQRLHHRWRRHRAALFALTALVVSTAFTAGEDSRAAVPADEDAIVALSPGGFRFALAIEVPGTPEQAWDAFTGDVGAWWDQHVFDAPQRLVIEPRAGGGFHEFLDEQGHGARHAVVTAAVPGRLLRMEGPLGLASHALSMVQTLEFSPTETGGTAIALSVAVSGEIAEGQAVAVQRTWRHLLVERFKPWYETERAASASPAASR